MIKVGDTVEVQDRRGVERFVIDGERYFVLEVHQSGMLKLQGDSEFEQIFIPSNQVKLVKERV